MELTEKLGVKRSEINDIWNKILKLESSNKLGKQELALPEILGDKVIKNWFGDDHDWKWFQKKGFIKWPKKVEEAYWRYFVDARVPIYLEYLLDIGKEVERITREIGVNVNTEQYTPLVDWFPCPPHAITKSEFDLYCYSYRDILHTGSHTMQQPWLDEASRMNPYTYNITMNEKTAKEKGIREADVLEIENEKGRKVKGPVKLVQGQHPLTIGIAACSGHWAKGLPIANGKGTHFDSLLEIDLNHVDPISLNLETCVRVKVSKAAK